VGGLMFVKKLIANAERAGFLSAYSYFRRRVTGHQIAIIMYHSVNQINKTFIIPSVTPDVFESQIQYLQSNFQLISLDKLSEMLKGSLKLPRKAVVVTLDDGYSDNFTYAYPILRKYGVPATVFVSSGYIDRFRVYWWDLVDYFVETYSANKVSLRGIGTLSLKSETDRLAAKKTIRRILKKMPEKEFNKIVNEVSLMLGKREICELSKRRMLSWAEIMEMHYGGISFGAHTVNHKTLTKTHTELCKTEIIQSKDEIEKKLKSKVTSFCFPSGKYDPKMLKIVEEAGFSCAVTTLPFGLVRKGDSAYSLRRVPAFEDFDVFKGTLSGIVGDLAFLYRS
jgi:peptidoglycan/xylan/chitin deacetylase (PgdA/CDA1 family)